MTALMVFKQRAYHFRVRRIDQKKRSKRFKILFISRSFPFFSICHCQLSGQICPTSWAGLEINNHSNVSSERRGSLPWGVMSQFGFKNIGHENVSRFLLKYFLYCRSFGKIPYLPYYLSATFKSKWNKMAKKGKEER